MGKSAEPDIIDDFINPDDDNDSVFFGENLGDQGHGMYLGSRLRLSLREISTLKTQIDQEINPALAKTNEAIPVSTYNVDISRVNEQLATQNLKLAINASNFKLKNIPVEIEKTSDNRTLVKVGPCDLSGVGGHQVRQEIIKHLVEQALNDKGLAEDFTAVSVSAVVGVRSRLQMLEGAVSTFFPPLDNREKNGAHMNSYVKTAGETELTHWEPRKGPQSFFDDTICGMVTAVVTSMFEHAIRKNSLSSSAEATTSILKSSALVELFNRILKLATSRITTITDGIRNLVKGDDFASPEANEQQPVNKV